LSFGYSLLDIGRWIFSRRIMVELFEFGKSVLESQPFSRIIGSELTRLEPGYAELALDVTNDHKQQHGFVHGGVIGYLADNSLTFAGGSILGDSVTSEYKINYIRPAMGERLVAQSSVLSSGKTQAVCECKVYAFKGSDKKLIAVAQGTINKIGE
jgi:uncharacterized protein (TIGR00369 family)